jgi:hypothetical protein
VHRKQPSIAILTTGQLSYARDNRLSIVAGMPAGTDQFSNLSGTANKRGVGGRAARKENREAYASRSPEKLRLGSPCEAASGFSDYWPLATGH